MPDTQGAQVPDEARAAGWDAYMEAVHANRDHPQRYASAIDVAAPLIVAAELERLATEFDGDAATRALIGYREAANAVRSSAAALRRRAAELRATATPAKEDSTDGH